MEKNEQKMKNPLNELIGVLLTFYNMNIIYDTNI